MRIWGLAATLALAVLAFLLGQGMGVAALTAVKSFDPLHVNTDGTALTIATLVADPVQTITLILAARLTGADVAAYFGLSIPRRRDVAIAMMALAVAIVLGDVLTVALGRDIVPAFQLDMFRSAQSDGTLVWLLISIVLVAPACEEFLFRGFLFRGLVREPRESLPGILIIALLWSLLHIQYDWLGIALVFVIGVMFGYVRFYTGSTLLVMLLHMLLNLESVGETFFVLGWL
jgi:membrane protease YdiL (CAAX protease family)